MQDLVGIGIADATQNPRIGEGALEGMIFGTQSSPKILLTRAHHIHPPRVERIQPCLPLDDVKGSPPFAPCFGECESTRWKIECREANAPRQLCATGLPVKTPGNHEVQHQPQVALYSNRNPFAHASQFADNAAFGGTQGRINSAQQKRCRNADPIQLRARNSGVESCQVGGNIRQFRHRPKLVRRGLLNLGPGLCLADNRD